jgi:hypothetical protein
LKRSKYGNIRSRCAQGKAHASKLEARRCDELHLLQKAGEIYALMAHPQRSWRLTANNVEVAKYVSDFDYMTSDGYSVVEDCKGVATPVYRLKKKLMLALYGIEVQEYPGKRR